MRDYLFRGYDKSIGEWSYGSLDLSDGDTDILFDDGYASVDPESVGQYTGLKDENGTKIFEGDIVECRYDMEDPTIHKVYWGGYEYPAFELDPLISEDMNGFAMIMNERDWVIKVIGNIYQNKELFE